jgi:hypothetical protein
VIISMAFKARVGKDLAADYLVQHYGFKKIAFAQPLKEAAMVIYGLTDEQLYGDLKEVVDPFWGETPRQILQTAGTNALRAHHRQDIWVMATKRKLIQEPMMNWCISDCRFKNEAEMVKSLGGKMIRVDASFPGRQEIKTGSHASEIDMLDYVDWDWILKNDSTKEVYYKRIDEMMVEYRKLYNPLLDLDGTSIVEAGTQTTLGFIKFGEIK